MSENDKASESKPVFSADSYGFTKIQEIIKDFVATVGVDRVFGHPIKHGEYIIIPAAEVIGAIGLGSGGGSGSSPECDDPKRSGGKSGSGSGGGAGGGGSVKSRPVAVITCSPEGVEVKPVLDIASIYLAFFSTIIFVISFIMKSKKMPNKIKM